MNTTTQPTENQLISLLGKPNEILQPITIEQILNSELIAYNPMEAKKTLKRIEQYSPKIFISKANTGVYSYDRLFMQYESNGVNFFTELSLFSSCLHSGGFREASLLNASDNVFVYYRNLPNCEGRAANTPKNWEVFRQYKYITLTDL
jgi:hypothetical protein